MVSRTSLTESIRRHRPDEVRDGLAGKPELLGYCDERGRSWLHLACSEPGTSGEMVDLLLGGANPDAQVGKGRTVLHLMLKKGSAAEHFAMFVAAGARGDIADGEGRTAVALLSRKRDPVWREIAAGLASQ